MGHAYLGRGSVPVFFSGRKPYDVAWMHFFHQTVFPLDPSKAGSDEDRLAERMGVPGCACARFKGDGGATDTRWVFPLEGSIDTNCPGEPVRWARS